MLLFLKTLPGSPLRGAPQRPKVLLATACAVGPLVILLLVSRLTAAWLASMVVGVTAGLCHAMNAPGAPLALGALSWTGVLGIGLAIDLQFLDADALVAAMGDALHDFVDTDSAANRAAEMPRRHGSRTGK